MSQENISQTTRIMEILASHDISTRAIMLGVVVGVISGVLYGLSASGSSFGTDMQSLFETGIKITVFLIGAGSLGKTFDFLTRESIPSA